MASGDGQKVTRQGMKKAALSCASPKGSFLFCFSTSQLIALKGCKCEESETKTSLISIVVVVCVLSLVIARITNLQKAKISQTIWLEINNDTLE